MSKRKGTFVKVGENLYRYSSSKVYYAVFRRDDKLNWKSLETDDREFAQRRLKELWSKVEKVDARQHKLSLSELIALYEDGLGKYDVRTQANKRSLVKCLRDTWKHGLEMPVRDVSEAHLSGWLAKQRQRMSRTGYNILLTTFLRLQKALGCPWERLLEYDQLNRRIKGLAKAKGKDFENYRLRY